MRTATIRQLRHETSLVLEWVEAGERVEIRKRGKPVAILSRPEGRAPVPSRPDFMARLKSIYGDQMLSVTATDNLAMERDDR